MKLRKYQEDTIINLRQSLAKGNKRIILQAPTGAGKTVMFSYMAMRAVQKNKKVIIITDRKELLNQAANKLINFDLDVALLNARTKSIPYHSPIVVAMSETLKRRIKKLDYEVFISKMDLIIIDEAHKNTFNKIFSFLKPNQIAIGATATPHRAGTKNQLIEFYDDIVRSVQINKLIKSGYLSNANTFGIPIDLSGIKTKRGDYDSAELSEIMDKTVHYKSVIENYKRICPNSKALVFSVSIKNSKTLCEHFIQEGYDARHLDSNMSEQERSLILNDYDKNKFQVLCNVGILTTGFDQPDIETIILFRATKSLPLFLQMCGRGSRVTDTKNQFTILDFGNNVMNHGFWEDDREWSLKLKKKRKKGVSPVKICPDCGAMLHASSMLCDFCGYEYPVAEKSQIEVILEKLTPSQIQNFASNDASIQELEEIRNLKGYKMGWVMHKLKNESDFSEYAKLKGYKDSWAKINFKRYEQK